MSPSSPSSGMRDAAETYALNFGDHVFAGPIEDVPSFPARRRRDRRAAVPGLLAAQHARCRLRAARALARVPARARRGRAASVRDGERAGAASLGGVRGFPRGRRGARVQRRGPHPQRGRLRRSADPEASVRDRRARRGAAVASSRPTPRAARNTRGQTPWRTFRDAVQGLSLEPDGERWHRPRNPRPRASSATERSPARARVASTSPSDGRTSRRPCWLRKKSGSTDVFGRLWWDRPAFTIRTEFYKPEKGRYLHPSEHRPITVREAARCMSFPDDFVFPEHQPMTSVAQQIGNAVCPRPRETDRDDPRASPLRTTPGRRA